jgi:hypothetical protein
MKLVYVDDQDDYVKYVKEACALLGWECSFLQPRDGPEPLYLDDEGARIEADKAPAEVEPYMVLQARDILNEVEQANGRIFLLDINFFKGPLMLQTYGIRLAKYLFKSSVKASRIVLLTIYPDRAQMTGLGGTAGPWIDVFAKYDIPEGGAWRSPC